jgi:hypothetical protein
MNSPKVKTANRKRRREKLQRQAEEMAELRAKVFARAGGKGELCGVNTVSIYGTTWSGDQVLLCRQEPIQLAHLNGGIGRRRQQQSIENCVAEHATCHSDLDARPLIWLPLVKTWCARYGYPLPERFRILEAKQLQQKGVTNG